MAKIINDEGVHEAPTIDYDNENHLWIEPETALDQIKWRNAKSISVHFPSFADGRGFGIATHLRREGFQGQLRAVGHIIVDQYRSARRVGFDEVEISDDFAKRQDASQWHAVLGWKSFDYQSRLGQVRANK